MCVSTYNNAEIHAYMMHGLVKPCCTDNHAQRIANRKQARMQRYVCVREKSKKFPMTEIEAHFKVEIVKEPAIGTITIKQVRQTS